MLSGCKKVQNKQRFSFFFVVVVVYVCVSVCVGGLKLHNRVHVDELSGDP